MAKKKGAALPPMPLFDAPASKAARDEGIARVTENTSGSWKQRYAEQFEQFLKERAGLTFTAEDYREWFLGRGNPQPHTPHAWGGSWNGLMHRGLIEETGQYVAMRDVRSHGRRTPLCRQKREG